MSAARTSPDVLVLGGGAAGLCAAVAARRAGADVVVLKKSEGATTLSSGAVDVADADKDLLPGAAVTPFDAGMSIAASLERLASTRPRHPYARVTHAGRQRMEQALALLEKTAAQVSFGKRSDGKNLVVATQLGTLKRAARVQDSLCFDLSTLPDDGRVLVVELRDLAGFDGKPVSEVLAWMERLSSAGPGAGKRRFDVVKVPAGKGRRVEASPRAYAASLTDDAARTALVERVAKALKERADDSKVSCALLPPVLGLTDAGDLARRLEEACGFPVRELLAMPQSAPGQRLAQALVDGAVDLGVCVRRADALSSLVEDGRVKEVRTREAQGEVLYRPRAIVLATGRFLAGGLVRDGYAIEPIFGLPLVAEGEVVGNQFIGGLTADRPEGDHAIFRAGVGYDDELRPTTESGAVLAENLFAAGSVLEGYDPARDGSGLGVCALTGLLAGEAAAASAKRP